MAKGNTVLKIAGFLLVLFGVFGILFAMWFGFVGALSFDEMGETALTGLLIFYGLFGILTGFFQIAAGSVAVRHSNKAGHWLRCLIWGVVMLVLGVVIYILLNALSGMIGKSSGFYPPWFCFVIIIIGCFVLPLLMILGGILNKITYNKETAGAVSVQEDYIGEMVSADEMPQPASSALSASGVSESGKADPVPKAGGRLDYLKSKRLKRNVDPRVLRKFSR